MRIRQKLILGFVSIALLIAVVGYISVSKSQKVLQESIGEKSTAFAAKMLEHIDRCIYSRIETFQQYSRDLIAQRVISESNKEFEKLDNIQAYISEKDREWTSAPKEEVTAFMQKLINNELSKELREKIKFYEGKYGYRVFGEVFITNKYGANDAQTGKTTDYYQADEQWWQMAKKDGLYVADVEYDRSANVYSTDICLRIDDEAGDLLGVMKVVLNIEEAVNIVKEAAATAEYETTEFKLLTGDGKIIYTTEEFKFLQNLPMELSSVLRPGEHEPGHTSYFIAAGDKPGEGEELFAHAHSQGYKDFKGLGWILVVEYETEEIFAPIVKLRSSLLTAALGITILAIFLGLVISKAISNPVGKLAGVAAEIGKGNLDTPIEVESSDEFGLLAASFKKMTEDLKETTTSIDELNKEIAERKRAEEALKEAKERADLLAREAQEASKAKSEFLANMSHGIRTPMNAIIGFSQILAEEELTDEQKGYADIIQDSGKDLLNLIDDILDLSRVEAGKIDIEIIDCSLTKLLAAIESLVRPEIKVKGLDFEVVAGDGLPAQIRTDPTRLRQCLLNLINNAIKFTEQGHVYVNVSLHQIDDKPFIRFDVEDTGIGIPEDKQAAVFESFTQVDGSSTRKFGGTGLGLTITKQLAGLLGGEVTVASEVGKGSVFSLTIPAGLDVTKQPFLDRHNIVAHLDTEQDKPEQAEFSGHVLVAEDSKTNQKLIKSLLARLGLDVTTAENGKEAVDKALTTRFDLIFMDIQMPKMNGYKATKMLRKKGITTPIVALTAYAMKGDDAKCIEAGCDDYMSKPIDPENLQQVLGKYVSPKGKDAGGQIDSIKSQADELCRVVCDTGKQGEPDSETLRSWSEERVIDWADLADRCNNDEELVKEIVEVFFADNPARLGTLAEAINTAKAVEIHSLSHMLKGAAATIGAKPLSKAAYRLELVGKQGDMENADAFFADIKAEFEKLKSFVSGANWIEIAKQQSNEQAEQLQSK